MDADYAAAYGHLYRHHWWWRAREHILVGVIRGLVAHRPEPVRILDVGCGAGLFFDALEPFGHVEGIESDAGAVALSGRWRSRIQVGRLETVPRESRFDLILMLDVIEHVERPEELLRGAAGRLARGGHVLVTVPAFQWLWTSHDDLNHHVKRYTAQELRAVIERSGLEPGRTRYLFPSLVLGKLAVRAREAIRQSENAVPRVPSPVINQALQTWLRIEHTFGGWLPLGSSVMATAHAPR